MQEEPTLEGDAVQQDLPGQEDCRHISLGQRLLRKAGGRAKEPRQLADER